MKTIKATVSGSVQGVGYRSLVVSSARALGVSGTVKNNSDGTVGIIAQGTEAAIKSFFARINVRNSSIRVEAIEKREVPGAKRCPDFQVEF